MLFANTAPPVFFFTVFFTTASQVPLFELTGIQTDKLLQFTTDRKTAYP